MAAQEPYQELRPGAFAIAYRMLGSVTEAEDLVQEGLLRLHRALEDGEPLESPRAYLSTIVTRLAIDELRSARARRETYVGEWLPEPLITSDEDAPARHAEIADSLSLAFLVLLETLSPEQRAVFLLRDVFDYPYDRIAAIVGKSEPATRQIATRARRHVDDRRPRYEASRRRRESWPSASSRLPATAIWRRSSPCSRRTSSSTVTAAVECPRSPAPCTAGAALPARWTAGSDSAAARAASRSGGSRSTGSPAR